MRKILYLLTKGPGQPSLDLLPKSPRTGEEISVILLQDGIFHRQVPASHVYMLSDDAVSKDVNSSFPSVSYQGLLQMMFEADGVVVL
ncbi:MAG: hypothetical protein ACRD98_12480 [Nitrososphaera sp.]